MAEPIWSFSAYVSEAGGRLVQDWYDSLSDEEHDELQDTLNFLAYTPDWRRPHFDKVTQPLHEIRSKAHEANHEIRVYGIFDPNVRRRFLMLNGTTAKKKDVDRKGQDVALNRLSLVTQRKAGTHEFSV